MTDEHTGKDFTNEQARKGFTIERMVVKDLSFERPMGPEVFQSDIRPEYSVRLHLGSKCVASKLWEFVITATVTAKLETAVAFLIEVQQAGLFTVVQLDTESMRRLAAIDAPNLIFPYLREAVDNVVVKGGFPAIGLQLPDFEAWYEDANKAKSTVTTDSDS